jgi:glyoxylase-like metal-dependent hydrolase (beta-lactamase superfamily II)
MAPPLPTGPGERSSEAARLAAYGIVRVTAANPGPLTLSGTNTWVVGRDPAYVIDPGPRLPEHLEQVAAIVRERGGLGGIALTHDHVDHSEAVETLRELVPVPLAGARGAVDVRLGDGDQFGPLEALAVPGHASDHLMFIAGRACFTGDAVLGEGSVFIAAERGALRGYLRGLERLRERSLDLLCPGHGPVIWDPRAKLDEYLAHRREREQGLIRALEDGARGTDELLDAAWSDVPAVLRPVAALTLAAHLDKLEDEGRLPADLQRARSERAQTRY